MTDRHAIIPAVWMIVKNETGQLFMLRRANTGWRDGDWTVPAGHVEKDEGPTKAAIRELKEEAGLDVSPADLKQVLVHFHPEDVLINERVSIFFTLEVHSDQPINAEPNKADKAAWFDLDNLPEKMPPILRQALHDIEAGIHYSERYYDDEYHKELLQ